MPIELVYWVPVAIGAGGAVWDILHRRLPNLLCVAMAVAAATALGLTMGIAALPWALAHSVIALLVGMVLFRLGMIGGGDAKFYAAAALGLPLDQGLSMLGWTSVAGLVLLAAMFSARKVQKIPTPKDGAGKWTVPYGVAIFFGYLLTVINSN
ncbi:A24 family peptidase [Altererythrobacter aquiaggeris]|uniref:A24 family peptidase n=1 Tax=Aestuarierythrobacter aquiaggeris TaxID=1898396 RepID=UPI00301A4F48